MRAYASVDCQDRSHAAISLSCSTPILRRLAPVSPNTRLTSSNTCRKSYLALSELIGGMTVIPAMPKQEVEREVLRLATGALPLRADQLNTPAMVQPIHAFETEKLTDPMWIPLL